MLPVLCLIKMENQEIHPSTLDDSLVPGQLSPRAVVEAALSIESPRLTCSAAQLDAVQLHFVTPIFFF